MTFSTKKINSLKTKKSSEMFQQVFVLKISVQNFYILINLSWWLKHQMKACFFFSRGVSGVNLIIRGRGWGRGRQQTWRERIFVIIFKERISIFNFSWVIAFKSSNGFLFFSFFVRICFDIKNFFQTLLAFVLWEENIFWNAKCPCLFVSGTNEYTSGYFKAEKIKIHTFIHSSHAKEFT